MSLDVTIWLTQKLILFAAGLQLAEFILLQKDLSEKGLWPWRILRKDYLKLPKILQNVLSFVMTSPKLNYVLYAGLIMCILGFIFPSWIFVTSAFLAVYLMAIRFRGSFNGGSDSMTVLILFFTAIAAFSENPQVQSIGAGMIAVNLILSYMNSGMAKTRSRDWQEGLVLQNVILSSAYAVPVRLQKIFKSRSLCKFVSGVILFYEISFPVVLLGPSVFYVYASAALVFHFLNFYIFGLNRFFWAWLAAYPALYYCILILGGPV